MRTISTKLDKKTAELFLKVCNGEGKCQSEMLRDLIENVCELEENLPELETEVESVKPTIEVISELENVRIVYD